VLLGTLEGNVLRLDAASGKSVATYPVGSPIRSQPVVADGWIYVGTEDGRLVGSTPRMRRSPAGRPRVAMRSALASRAERHSPDSRYLF
jgi:hypothetical protein